MAAVSSQPEAEALARVLISNGLDATVAADGSGQPWSVRVMVGKSDEASARQLLAIADRTPGVAGQCGGD